MPLHTADLLIEHASLIATCAGPAPRCGPSQRDIGAIADAVVAAARGTITYVGPATALTEHVEILPDVMRVDASGCTVLPGFVDPHTHAVFAGDRRDELRRRLAGESYGDIAASGGGIVRTVADTRAASEDQLILASRARLDEMLAFGTTTCEVKSGYGLSVESELKLLRVIKALDADHALDLVPTFLGAHDLPLEYRDRRDAYVRVVIDDMIPVVAREGLAEWCDVFCDVGAFTPDESFAILQAGLAAGLQPRIHADELASSGGAHVAARVGARAADHLIFADERAADALASAGTCAVLLPIAALYLKLGRFAPARMLVDRGVPVALGTDVNPGGGLSPSMPFAITLACLAMDMTLEEALIAATLNAAWSIDRSQTVGSLEVGKQMDAVIIDGDLVDLLRVGASRVRTVIKRGRVARHCV